jgi:hypothetical protein
MSMAVTYIHGPLNLDFDMWTFARLGRYEEEI